MAAAKTESMVESREMASFSTTSTASSSSSSSRSAKMAEATAVAMTTSTAESSSTTTEMLEQKSAKKFKPKVFAGPPRDVTPPLQKPPKINLKEAPPIRFVTEVPQVIRTEIVDASFSMMQHQQQQQQQQQQTLKLQMVDPAVMLTEQWNGQAEVDYSADMVTSAAKICLSPTPEPAKTVKWKTTNLVTVSHFAS